MSLVIKNLVLLVSGIWILQLFTKNNVDDDDYDDIIMIAYTYIVIITYQMLSTSYSLAYFLITFGLLCKENCFFFFFLRQRLSL
jgi:hypothetical protein